MRNVSTLIVLVFFVLRAPIFACSCIGIPCTFLACELRDDQHVVHARVIGHDRLDDADQFAYQRELTVLQVLDELTDRSLPDTIYFYHGQSSACDRMLSSNEIGDEFILRLHRKTFFEAELNIPLYAMSICDRPELRVLDGKVHGYITKNRKCERREKCIMKQQEKLGPYAQIDHDKLPKGESKRQHIALKRFYKKWTRQRTPNI